MKLKELLDILDYIYETEVDNFIDYLTENYHHLIKTGAIDRQDFDRVFANNCDPSDHITEIEEFCLLDEEHKIDHIWAKAARIYNELEGKSYY